VSVSAAAATVPMAARRRSARCTQVTVRESILWYLPTPKLGLFYLDDGRTLIVVDVVDARCRCLRFFARPAIGFAGECREVRDIRLTRSRLH